LLYTSPNKNISSILGTTPEEIDIRGRGSDRYVLMSVIILMIFGVLAVYSSIAYFAETRNTTAGSLVTGHMLKVGIAFLVMLIVSKMDYRIVAKFSRIAVVISWLLLIAVLIYGDVVFGAKRSLNLGAFSFQPSSVAAVALLVHVSVLLHEKQEYIKDFKRSFLPIMVWITITCGLIGLEDFSSAALLMAICFVLMFIGRISVMHLSALILIGAIGGATLISSSLERQSRVKEYVAQVTNINSSEFNLDHGYQAQQAYIAIAQGKMTGVGIGKSVQRDFLPAPYNDFIFAIIAEEYGIIGSAFIILLFGLILVRGIAVIARNAVDNLGVFLAVACTLMITLYGFVNAMVASGLLPVTGLPMPFVSYGGTSMLFTGIMVGLLLNISKHSRNKPNLFYNS
jgi:cell division protein FtsW